MRMKQTVKSREDKLLFNNKWSEGYVTVLTLEVLHIKLRLYHASLIFWKRLMDNIMIFFRKGLDYYWPPKTPSELCFHFSNLIADEEGCCKEKHLSFGEKASFIVSYLQAIALRTIKLNSKIEEFTIRLFRLLALALHNSYKNPQEIKRPLD